MFYSKKIKYFLSSLILIILLLVIPSSAQVFQPKNTVKFAQISDVHISNRENKGGRMLKHSKDLFNDAVQQVNNINNLDFVVFTGDMINKPDKNLFKDFTSIANNLNIPWFWTIGNHDIDWRLSRKEFLNSMNANNPYQQEKTYHSFQIGNFTFIFMDGTIETKIVANAYFSKKELLWLEHQLKTAKNSYVVIFQHYPVVEPYESFSHKVLNSGKYLKILDKYNNIIAVVSGHYHGAKIKMRNNVAHISSPALVQYPNAFRVITLKNIGDYVFIDFEFIPTKLLKVSNKSYDKTGSAELNYGKKEDRQGTIILRNLHFMNNLNSYY